MKATANDGEIIATSEGYKAKASAMGGIESIGKNAPEAAVEKTDKTRKSTSDFRIRSAYII